MRDASQFGIGNTYGESGVLLALGDLLGLGGGLLLALRLALKLVGNGAFVLCGYCISTSSRESLTCVGGKADHTGVVSLVRVLLALVVSVLRLLLVDLAIGGVAL